jgi:hypothetical protein
MTKFFVAYSNPDTALTLSFASDGMDETAVPICGTVGQFKELVGKWLFLGWSIQC